MTIINKFTNDIINKIIIEFNKPENKLKINEHIINPLIIDLSNKIYPYVLSFAVMYIIIMVLIIVIFFLLIKN